MLTSHGLHDRDVLNGKQSLKFSLPSIESFMFFAYRSWILLVLMAEANEKLPHRRFVIPSFPQAFLQIAVAVKDLKSTYTFSCHSEMDFKCSSQNLYTGVSLTVVQKQFPEREEKINGSGNCFNG
ncbi:hypothetical protein llap_17180 [Limosa lapponica baueri]|uniref:Uncharacterized protein n=1 Tax=Limosa lapponica baueri TaxID=1758121 RepID=A0A2I0TFH3_LIMLA|nr:hypothetical protein llap_17180 [Limosa lapponica baueri]